jgi:hypothetical protein
VQAAEAAVGCTSRKDATFLRHHRSTSIRWQNGSRRAAWIEWNQSEHKPMGLFIISFTFFFFATELTATGFMTSFYYVDEMDRLSWPDLPNQPNLRREMAPLRKDGSVFSFFYSTRLHLDTIKGRC